MISKNFGKFLKEHNKCGLSYMQCNSYFKSVLLVIALGALNNWAYSG